MGRATGDSGRPVPADGVRLRVLDDEGILFDARRRMVYFLNTAATLMWCRIESGEALFPPLERPAEDAGAPAKSARDIVARWLSLGLLVEPGAPPRPILPAARKTRRRIGKPVPPPAPPAVWRHYRLLHSEVALAFCDAALAALVHPTLAHLAIDTPAGNALVIAIDRGDGGFRLIEGGRLLDACRSPGELAPLVKLHAARLAVGRFPHRLAVHAGAVASAAGSLLLPAAAGSGKSVLTAALMARGWGYLSDDTALLDDADFSVTGVAYSLTVKEGGWDVVAPHFPELMRQRVHRRPDGQSVRYLPPMPRAAGSGPAERQVRWIVSPRFAGSARPAALRRLTRAAAFRLLLANCGWVRPLDWETIDRTIEWLGGIASYRLLYSSIDAAVEAIETLAKKR